MSYAIVFKENEDFKQRIIQSKLFEQGFTWFGSNSKEVHIDNSNYIILFVYEDEKVLTRKSYYFSSQYSGGETYLEQAVKIVKNYHPSWKTISVSEILNPKPMSTE